MTDVQLNVVCLVRHSIYTPASGLNPDPPNAVHGRGSTLGTLQTYRRVLQATLLGQAIARICLLTVIKFSPMNPGATAYSARPKTPDSRQQSPIWVFAQAVCGGGQERGQKDPGACMPGVFMLESHYGHPRVLTYISICLSAGIMALPARVDTYKPARQG
jgi:hypothetical protein